MLQQIRSFMRADFQVLGAHGEFVARIHTGSTGWLGPRELYVTDALGPVFHLKDPIDFALDTFTIHVPDDQPIGHIRQRMTMLNRAFDVELLDGAVLLMERRSLSFETYFTFRGGEVARATKQWAGWSAALSGRDHYVLHIVASAPPLHRIGMLAGLLALDLNAAKDD